MIYINKLLWVHIRERKPAALYLKGYAMSLAESVGDSLHTHRHSGNHIGNKRHSPGEAFPVAPTHDIHPHRKLVSVERIGFSRMTPAVVIGIDINQLHHEIGISSRYGHPQQSLYLVVKLNTSERRPAKRWSPVIYSAGRLYHVPSI